eukprot:10210578-Heterocapsa_arctica.AAC.1
MLRLNAANADRMEPTMTSMALSRAAGVEAMTPMASSSTKVTSTSGSAVSAAVSSAGDQKGTLLENLNLIAMPAAMSVVRIMLRACS